MCRLFSVVVLSLAVLPGAWAKERPFPIKVLSAESQQVEGPPLAPPDCNWKDISAYCYSSSPETYLENTMVIQEPDGKPIKITCTVYNQWSHCVPLPVNQTFEARIGRRGLEIRHIDPHGKVSKQLYEILGQNEKR